MKWVGLTEQRIEWDYCCQWITGNKFTGGQKIEVGMQ